MSSLQFVDKCFACNGKGILLFLRKLGDAQIEIDDIELDVTNLRLEYTEKCCFCNGKKIITIKKKYAD